ncbi:MAG: response regulator transcription factor [Candidatus Riflebacteria bacterium]|nr:response regulator transcription factor [Candidatus Riflebacteria bacterium]
MTTKPVRIFLLEDHPVMRLGLKMMLEERGFEVCGEAENAEQALKLLPEAAADVAVLDLSLQGETALQAVAECRQRFPALAIIIYSMHDTPLFVESAMRAGANGYVTKADPVAAIVNAIEDVRQGKQHFGPSLARELQKQDSDLARQGLKLREITGRELEVLTLLGQGFGLAEIADRFCISTRTVETHLNHLREKLGVKTNRELTRAAIQFLHPG